MRFMPDIEALRERLRNTRNITGLARTCGISSKTLFRTRDGVTTPNLVTFQKILACLDAHQKAAS